MQISSSPAAAAARAYSIGSPTACRLSRSELDAARAAEARRNFERAGVSEWVDAREGDARELLRSITDPVDFLLLDNDFQNYHPCFRAIEPHLTSGTVILADNVGI